MVDIKNYIENGGYSQVNKMEQELSAETQFIIKNIEDFSKSEYGKTDICEQLSRGETSFNHTCQTNKNCYERFKEWNNDKKVKKEKAKFTRGSYVFKT